MTLRSGSAPPPGGTALGSDLLCLEAGGSFHSFLCNRLEAEVPARFGVVPNTWGLYDDPDVAPWLARQVLDDAREADGDSTSKARVSIEGKLSSETRRASRAVTAVGLAPAEG